MPTEDDDFSEDDRDTGEEPAEAEDTDLADAPQTPAPPPRPKVRDVKNNRGKAGAGTPKLTAEGVPNTRFNFKDADLLWGEILAWLGTKHKTAYDVTIQVVRTEPPPSVAIPPNFDGSSVVGDSTTSPSDALVKRVIDYYHMPTARQQSQYSIRFLWKVNSARIATGNLTLPSPEEVISLRNNAARMQGGQPPPQQQMGQGYQQPPPQGFGAPPPQGFGQHQTPNYPHQTPQYDPAAMQELAYLRGSLNEALSAAREGRQPNLQPPPPGVAAPAQPAFNEDAIVDKVAAKVALLLGRVLPPAGVAAPVGVATPPAAAPNPANSLTGMVEKMVMGIMETSLKTVMGSVEKQVKAVGTGMGAPPAVEEEEEVAEPTPPEDPVPWHVAPVSDVKWPDGTPVRYAADKETKDISPMGLAFSNPYVAEKVMGMANGVAEAIKKVVTDAAQGAMGRQPGAAGVGGLPPAPPQQQAQVVDSIPHDAVNGQPPAERGGWPSV